MRGDDGFIRDGLVEPDYGIITDAYGDESTEGEWDSAIGKPPSHE